MWVAAERPPRTRAARLFVFSRTCVIISKPVTPCKTFRGNMAEFFNRLLDHVKEGGETCYHLQRRHDGKVPRVDYLLRSRWRLMQDMCGYYHGGFLDRSGTRYHIAR